MSARARTSGRRPPQQERSQRTRLALLEAALDCLVEEGYANLAASRVSERAGVSRGAQQHHFPHRATLVVEAVNHLFEQQIAQLMDGVARLDGDPVERVERVLELLWTSYAGPLYTAWLELLVAARTDAELHDHLDPLNRQLGHTLLEVVNTALALDSRRARALRPQVELALAAIRGLALLRSAGQSERSLARQWHHMRSELVELLTPPASDTTKRS